MLCKQLRVLRTNVLETQKSSQLDSAIGAMATMHIKVANSKRPSVTSSRNQDILWQPAGRKINRQ